MAENVHAVSIGEMIVSNNPDDVLVAYGLGSCAAVILYDPLRRLGGMVHSLLPAAPPNASLDGTAAKFVDHGVPMLIDAMVRQGAERGRLVAALCGGAQMITAPGLPDTLNIGSRNIAAAESALRAAGISLRARATGGNVGRTVKLIIKTGQMTIKCAGKSEEPLI